MPLAPPHPGEVTENRRDQPIALPPRRLPHFERFAPARFVGRMSPDEYLALERRGEVRLEYVEGAVIKVAGGGPEHNLIGANTLRSVGDSLETIGADCAVYGSDQKIAIAARLYRYPDVVVACGDIQIDTRDALQNPILIVEVLSPSTEREDRTDKFRDYQRITSLRHYILIDQQRPYVTHFEKLAQGKWAIMGEYTNLAESLVLTINNHEVTVPLAAIYRRIPFTDESSLNASVNAETQQEETTV